MTPSSDPSTCWEASKPLSSRDQVLLKPNLVRSMPPERAATTHPTVVAAVARLVIEAGAHPLIADSPGGPYTPATLRSAYRRTGMEAAAEASGAELNYDTAATQVSNAEGIVLHRLDLINPLLEVDAVINLPKLKTHNLTVLTMGVKNLFGVVPGALKIGYHSKLVDRERFCEGLLDILQFVRPTLTVLDAIIGMEGEGPTGGDPRQIGAIVTSTDVLAVDTLGATLVGMEPDIVTTTRLAAARGLTTGKVDDLEILGDSLDNLRITDFREGIDTPLDADSFPPRCAFWYAWPRHPRPTISRTHAVPGRCAVWHRADLEADGGQATCDRTLYRLRLLCPTLSCQRHRDRQRTGSDGWQDMHSLLLLPRALPARCDRAVQAPSRQTDIAQIEQRRGGPPAL